MEEFQKWLKANKISYKTIDQEVVFIPDFGKIYYEDTEKLKSIFRLDNDKNMIFNSMEEPSVLMNEGIFYIAFKFGDNYYYYDLRKDFKLNIVKYIGKRTSPVRQESFVNLGVHTPFELLNGSFSIEQWVNKAVYCGHKALGVCDLNTMASLFSLQKACKANDLKPVFGYSLVFIDGENKVGAKVYVQSQKGLRNLLRIQKSIMVDNVDSKLISYSELLNRGEGNVLVLDKYSSFWMNEHTEMVEDLTNAFDHIYYQVDLSEYKAERIDIKVLEATKYYFDFLYKKQDIFPEPILISDCYYLDQNDAKNKIILNKIAEGAAHEQSADQYFKDIDEHYEYFAKLFNPGKWNIEQIFKQCCDNTIVIANGANAYFENTRNFMPKYDMKPEEKAKYGSVHEMFNQLLEDGFKRLVPKGKEEQYRQQLIYEKYIIESTNNVDYLLVQYDTCNWSRENGILVGCGRGSAAGSLLLYLLGITLIDPIKYNLIFERFLLPERAGLYPSKTTIIGEDIDSTCYASVILENNKEIKIDKDSQLLVKRAGSEKPIIVYGDELMPDDDIIFDNKDILFTINEL